MTKLAEQLKQLRTEKQLSQEALAEQLHISRQSISKWENGDATPDLEHLVKMSEILEVSLDELILAKKPEVIKERKFDNWEPWKVSNGWEFLARFWWIPIPLLAFLSWFLPRILPNIFG